MQIRWWTVSARTTPRSIVHGDLHPLSSTRAPRVPACSRGCAQVCVRHQHSGADLANGLALQLCVRSHAAEMEAHGQGERLIIFALFPSVNSPRVRPNPNPPRQTFALPAPRGGTSGPHGTGLRGTAMRRSWTGRWEAFPSLPVSQAAHFRLRKLPLPTCGTRACGRCTWIASARSSSSSGRSWARLGASSCLRAESTPTQITVAASSRGRLAMCAHIGKRPCRALRGRPPKPTARRQRGRGPRLHRGSLSPGVGLRARFGSRSSPRA